MKSHFVPRPPLPVNLVPMDTSKPRSNTNTLKLYLIRLWPHLRPYATYTIILFYYSQRMICFFAGGPPTGRLPHYLSHLALDIRKWLPTQQYLSHGLRYFTPPIECPSKIVQ